MSTKTIILRPYKVEFADISLTPIYPSTTIETDAHLLVNEEVSDGDATYINYANGGTAATVHYYFKCPCFNNSNITNFSLYMHTRLESSEDEDASMIMTFYLPELDESLYIDSTNIAISSADYHYIKDNHVNTSTDCTTFLSLLNNATVESIIKCTTNLVSGINKFAPARVTQVYLELTYEGEDIQIPDVPDTPDTPPDDNDDISKSCNEFLQENNLLLQGVLDRINSISLNNAASDSSLLSNMSIVKTCTLNIEESIGSIIFFQKNESNNTIELKNKPCVGTFRNIPLNSMIILVNPVIDGSCIINNLVELDYFGRKGYKVAGQEHYNIFIITGDATLKSGNNTLFADYMIQKTGDTDFFVLSNYCALNANESYTSTVSPINDYYVIASVVVKMGEVDITSTAYDGYGKIHIDKISGDVEIYVDVEEPINLVLSATTEPGGTEIYDTDGYKDDYRWSSSAGGESSYTGGRITGWIPYSTGCTYIAKNFNPKAGYANGGYIIYRNTSGSNVAAAFGMETSSNYRVDIVNDEIEILLQNSNYTHFRVSGYSGDDIPEVYCMCPIEVNGNTDKFTLSNSVNKIVYGLPYKAKVESEEFTNFIVGSDTDGLMHIPDEGETCITIKMGENYITEEVFDFTTHEINIPEVTGVIYIDIFNEIDWVE